MFTHHQSIPTASPTRSCFLPPSLPPSCAWQAVTTATQVLSLCVRAGRYIECRQLYKAYRVLEGIQRDYGSVLRGPLDAR